MTLRRCLIIILAAVATLAASVGVSYVVADPGNSAPPAVTTIQQPKVKSPSPSPPSPQAQFRFKFKGLTLSLSDDWKEKPPGGESSSKTLWFQDVHGVRTDLSFYDTPVSVEQFEQIGKTRECDSYSPRQDARVGGRRAFYYAGSNCGPAMDQIHRIWLVPDKIVIVAASEFGGDPEGKSEGDLHQVRVLLSENATWK